MAHSGRPWQLLHNYVQKKQTDMRNRNQRKEKEKKKTNHTNKMKRKEDKKKKNQRKGKELIPRST